MTARRAPRIAVISAVSAAIAPAADAIAEHFGEAETWNLLDDRLLSDADAAGGLNDALQARMNRLIAHAIMEGADGVLLTCSLYGVVARATSPTVPVLAPDEAAFDDIAKAGYASVLVVASFDGARDDSVDRLRRTLAEAGSSATVAGLSVPAAMAAATSGEREALVIALREALTDKTGDADAVFLAQYSLAPAADELADAIGIPVLSGPANSADALRRAIIGIEGQPW